jgi:hypothetical protein
VTAIMKRTPAKAGKTAKSKPLMFMGAICLVKYSISGFGCQHNMTYFQKRVLKTRMYENKCDDHRKGIMNGSDMK